MRIFSGPYRLPAGIGLLLLASFSAVALIDYQVASDAMRQQASETLTLTADAIESELRAELAQPAALAKTTAADPALHAWLANGEQDEAQILHYLADLRQKHGLAAGYLVAEASRKHYGADGAVKPVEAGTVAERWLRPTEQASLTIEPETDATGALRLQLRHRLQDANGASLGVLGLAVPGDAFAARVKNVLARSGAHLYLVGPDGTAQAVATGSASATAEAALREMAGLVRQANGEPVQREIRLQDEPVRMEARRLPQSGWNLVIERNDAALLQPLQQALATGLAAGAVATLLALAILMLSVSRYRLQLARMAGTDSLTGMLNRQAFEIVFRQSVNEAERNGRPLSAILFDVDFLRRINDEHGQLAGDNVLRKIAQLARDAVRDSDILARWGGEEFVILLKECPLEQAAVIAENLREAVDRYDFSAIVPDRHITVSLGVAQCGLQEQASLFFLRTDGAMGKAKANGRNRLQVAPAGVNEGLALA
jgi:diguanylate cyclase (GGDEF)-like protein